MTYTKTVWTNGEGEPIDEDNLNKIEDGIYDAHEDLAIHKADTTNPHSVTKTQVGLGNVTDDAQLKAADLVTTVIDDDTKVPSASAIVDYLVSNPEAFIYATDVTIDNLSANGDVQTTITDSDAHLPTSGAVVDYVNSNPESFIYVTDVTKENLDANGDIETTITDNDNTVPTSGAVVDYVNSNPESFIYVTDVTKENLDANGDIQTTISDSDAVIPTSGAVVDYAIPLTQRAAANGVATLGADSKIPLSQIPDTIVGSVEYQGTWDADIDDPTLPAASGVKGDYYVVSVAGTFETIEYAVGDWIISNGTSWEKVDNTDQVTSVFGRQGAVTAQAGDYTASDVGLGNVTNDLQLKASQLETTTTSDDDTKVPSLGLLYDEKVALQAEIDSDVAAATSALQSEIDSDIATHTAIADAHHTNANDPTSDQKAAMNNANGPTGANPFATQSDLATAGEGGMTKAVYDTNDDGIVDKAELIDDGGTGKSYADISAEIDSDVSAHASDATAHHSNANDPTGDQKSAMDAANAPSGTNAFATINDLSDLGGGDMLKATYDSNGDGKVDAADNADAVPWTGVTGKPSTYPPETHNHTESEISDLGSYVPTSEKGANGGVATLDTNGKVPTAQLPEIDGGSA